VDSERLPRPSRLARERDIRLDVLLDELHHAGIDGRRHERATLAAVFREPPDRLRVQRQDPRAARQVGPHEAAREAHRLRVHPVVDHPADDVALVSESHARHRIEAHDVVAPRLQAVGDPRRALVRFLDAATFVGREIHPREELGTLRQAHPAVPRRRLRFLDREPHAEGPKLGRVPSARCEDENGERDYQYFLW